MDEQQLLALKPELDRFLDRFAPLFRAGRESDACTPLRSRAAPRRRTTQRREHCGGHERRARAIAPSLHHHRRLARSRDPHRAAPLSSWRSSATMMPSGTPTRRVSPRREPSRSASSASTPAPWAEPTTARSPCLPTTASAKGHTFMDRRLFLPEEWASDLTVGRRPVYRQV